MDFDTFFSIAITGAPSGAEPYPHQRAIAEDGPPELLVAATGTGKTEAAVLGWAYRRLAHESMDVRRTTPRWLVFALPTRGLVDQTVARVEQMRANLIGTGDFGEAFDVLAVKGGEHWSDRAWRLAPERTTIFVGTVDMLLSRALNRGYADSRWLWPISFGLFNNDCHWVFDEIQLMELATVTSRQLQSFRESLGTCRSTTSMWMSATVDKQTLETVDRPTIQSALDLSQISTLPEHLRTRLDATKTVRELPDNTDKEKDLATAVVARHRRGERTLVICNTVKRAVATANALGKVAADDVAVRLLHSRFRPGDKHDRTVDATSSDLPAGGAIVVATQVLEAGIDLDASVLVTDAAPWPSLVQRAGRCNRAGHTNGAELWWTATKKSAPYDEDDVQAAVDVLRSNEGVVHTPASLLDIAPPSPPKTIPTLRRRDLVDLFDTTPDLAGNDIDVSRYIRDIDDRTAYVAWRDPDERAAWATVSSAELCPAPVAEVRDFVKRKPGQFWILDHLAVGDDDRWVPCRPNDIRPGATVVADSDAGGYSPALGWDLTQKAAVAVVDESASPWAADDVAGADPASWASDWLSLSDHLADVEVEAGELSKALVADLPVDLVHAAEAAGALHDVGKAHPVFQDAALDTDDGPPPAMVPVAKTNRRGRLRYAQPHFRHELASLLALLDDDATVLDGLAEKDLVRYLVAAHHGRVRVGLRRLPGETAGDDGADVVLGVVAGTTVGEVTTPRGPLPPTEMRFELDGLPLSTAWLERTLRLRDRADLGPFRLAFLEAVVRVADWRASATPGAGSR